MASSYDVAPALGHGIVTAQGLAGGYDAIDDRRQWSIGRQEGATSATAYKVTPRSEGANLSVDIATNDGHYLVQGDDVLYQGLYLIPATALKTNLSLADPPDITRPRLDQIVVEARDDAHTSDGITRGRVYVLSGTPTTGATLTNRDGAADLPDSTARLADLLVPANATQLTSAELQDRRSYGTGLVVAGNALLPGVTTAWVTVNSVTVESQGRPFELRWSAQVQHANTSTSSSCYGQLLEDGVAFATLGNSGTGEFAYDNRPFVYGQVSGGLLRTPSVGRHVYELQLKNSSAFDWTPSQNSLTLIERP